MPFSIFSLCEELAKSCGFEPVRIPEALSERVSTRPETPLRMVSFAWNSPEVQQFRLTELTGALDTYMINIGILPRSTSMLPLMQLELLVVKQRLFLFIADALPLHTSAWGIPTPAPHDYLSCLAKAHPDLPATSERPEWSKQVISERAIWSRPNTTEAIASAADACRSFLAWCGDVMRAGVAQSVPTEVAEARQQFLRQFRTVFLEHEPSRPYFSSMFGADWAERFMSHFLFPEIEGRESSDVLSFGDTQRIDCSAV